MAIIGIKDDCFFYEDVVIPLNKIEKVEHWATWTSTGIDIYLKDSDVIYLTVYDSENNHDPALVDELIAVLNELEKYVTVEEALYL